MTNVIIHIYPGRGKEEEREFYNKKELGINIFKEYLLGSRDLVLKGGVFFISKYVYLRII